MRGTAVVRVKRDETTGLKRGLLDGERVLRTACRCSETAITIRLGFTWASKKNDWMICDYSVE